MSTRNSTVALASLCLASLAGVAFGQTSTNVVTDANGVRWQETRSVSHQLVPTTEMHTRTEQVYTPQVATSYQTYQQNHITPVTEYRWVSRRRGVLNPFVAPYWQHQLEPFTRWENRPTTVQVPVTTTNWVAGTRTVQTPVTTYKSMPVETTHKVALNSPPTTVSQPATAVAAKPLSPIGGQQMQSDPPRTASGWSSASTTTNNYR